MRPSQTPKSEKLLQPNSTDTLRHQLAKQLAESIESGGDFFAYTEYADRPIEFIEEVLGVQYMWGKLREICRAVRDNRYVVLQSANSVGKTFIAARIALWWNNAFPVTGDEQNKVITTAAPPERQIKELLWGEIKNAWRIAKENSVVLVGNDPGAMSLRINESWWIQGFTIPQTGTPKEREARFQGHHAKHLLFILDEAYGIPDEVYDAVESCISGGHNHILLLSNPMAPSGPYYNAVNDPRYCVIRLSAFDHPNVISGKELISGCVTRDHTVDRIKRWSRALVKDEPQDSSCFVVPDYFENTHRDDNIIGGQVRKVTSPFLWIKTLGEFPTHSENSLISIAAIQNAMERWIPIPPVEIPADVGLDVAEFGADSNAWITRRGYWTSPVTRWDGMDPIQTGSLAIQKARELPNRNIVYIDTTSIGAGIDRHLNENNVTAIGVKAASSPTIAVPEGEFVILRDQLLWAVREWLHTEPNAMLPPDRQLAQELSVLTYDVDMRGRIRAIKKDEIKKLIGRSPDALDALALTFYREKPWKSLKFISV